MDWVGLIRLTNALGATTALILLLVAAHRHWSSWNFKTQQHWWAFMGWTALCLEATIESTFLNIAGGPRTVLTTLVVAWTLRAILINDSVHSHSWHKRKDET